MTLLNRIVSNIGNRQQVTGGLGFINERLERELGQRLTPPGAVPVQKGLAARLRQIESQRRKMWPQVPLKDRIGDTGEMSVYSPKLFALYGHIQPAEYTIETDICTMGRSETCQIVVPLKIVSRLHAKIERESLHYILYDSNSGNGTFVNGRQIREPHWLADQDLIGLGADTPLLRFEDLDSTLQLTLRLRYDLQTMTFFLDQKPVALTPVQFRLLHHLYRHAGSVCTRTSCAEVIWGRAYDPGLDADALERTISNLRRQLTEVDPTADLIETRQGLGYVLNLS
jgi:pSer/pThr/pTyr-binding forkhead associated (FHA) protein